MSHLREEPVHPNLTRPPEGRVEQRLWTAGVSVVSTIGYGAFLAGPPLLGYLGDHTSTLTALLAVAALMVPAALTG